MPSQSSKSPLAPSTKSHTFPRKSTGESPLIKITRTSVSVEVRTSQFTNWLTPRSNESNDDESDLHFSVKIHGNSLIVLRMRTTSSMTTNPPKRKQLLIFAPVGAEGMIPIFSMKIIQASCREWNHPYSRLPHSREQSKRRRSSRTLIRMSPAQLSRLCTERANPLLHQFSSTKTLL